MKKFLPLFALTLLTNPLSLWADETFLDAQVNQLMDVKTQSSSAVATKTENTQTKQVQKTNSSNQTVVARAFSRKSATKTQKSVVKSPSLVKEDLSKPVSLNEETNTPAKTEVTSKEADANKELNKITKDRKKNTEKTIDAMNFIQPSMTITKDEQSKVNMALTRAEQEQLTILWRSTLERNKTIHFIVEKLTPDDQNKKKNQVLSQILNTAIFLPFYALQTVAPADTSQLASYIGAGLASDLINGKARKNSDRMQLSQTEMVIMFMMIDQVAERLREQYHAYKQEKIDAALAAFEIEEAKQEAAAALQTSSAESQFLSQVRIRQIEREQRRINLRVRSNRIVLVDLSGSEAVDEVDKMIDKEIAAIIDLPPVAMN